jgi:hypothetical protein
MTFLLLEMIAIAFYSVFGGSLLFLIIIVGLLAMLLLSLRAGGWLVFVIVIVPVLTTIGVYGGQSVFFQGLGQNTYWIPIAAWAALGVVTAGAIYTIIRW